ncbi:MAG TPA: molybdate ABC transporter substrate-binding protein [Acidimicrobiales bacterium]|nr:molybdate ABC transporter substrate-binding protein [Acidimicrobiales bacterium]
MVVASITAGACGGSSPKPHAKPTTVLVSAASSLREAFSELESTFELEHDRVDVVATFGASSALATQLAQGAPADVFVSADDVTMQKVRDAGRVAGTTTVIARNRIAMVVERDNPKGVASLQDLRRSDLVVVLCAAPVPCGRLAAAALRRAGVDVIAASYEENVKGVLSKVTLGEADVGVVYESDVRAAGDDVGSVAIDIAAEPEFQAVYPAAVLEGAPQPARAWLAFLRSRDAQAVLAKHGFLSP